MTTAYAVDSYLKGERKPSDPWGKECFISFADAFINHQKLIVPLPTRQSVGHTDDKNLPNILAKLYRAEAVIIAERHVAEDFAPSEGNLLAALGEFKQMVSENRATLRKWLEFVNHSLPKQQHIARIPNRVQPFVEEFWNSTRDCARFEEQTAIQQADLTYAFDVFCRGQQYDEVLSAEKATYFNHPIRKCLLSTRAQLNVTGIHGHSWGVLLDYLIKQKKIRALDIADWLVSLRTEVHCADASMSDLQELWLKNPSEATARLKTVVGRVGLPMKLKPWVPAVIQTKATAVGAFIDNRFHTFGLATLIINRGVAALDLKERYMPNWFGKVKIARGAMRLPEFSNT